MSDFVEMFSTLLDEPVAGGNGHAQKLGMSDGAVGSSGSIPYTSATEIKVDDSSPPVLLDRKPPQYVRQQEMAWHRIAMEYHSQGYTAREIAEMLGCSPTAVQDILRQPQYQKMQVTLIKQEVNRDRQVVEYIKENVLAAVETLGNITKDTKAKPADRIAAARELLNRRYGMPNQPINRNTDVDLNKLTDSELAQMLVATN